MKRVITINEASALPERKASSKGQWTVLIPMAGQGKRLGFDKPKALYPLLGKPLLSWLIERFQPFANEFVFVVSPEGEASIRDYVRAQHPEVKSSFGIQETPKGMAHAIASGVALVQTEHVMIVWGDQVLLSPATIEGCLRTHEARKNAKLTFPTLLRKDPYIVVDRNQAGQITAVRQRREGEISEAFGENDCGLFFVRTENLIDVLEKAQAQRLGIGLVTKEENFLPLIPSFDDEEGAVVTVHIQSVEDTLGINTVEDAKLVEQILQARGEEALNA